MREYPIHDLAELFPLHEGPALDDLAEDMAGPTGQLEPVTLYQGKILDGRRRYLAARRQGLELKTRVFKGDDAQALAYVVAKNLYRRHLSESERALVAAKIVTRRQGSNQHAPATAGSGETRESPDKNGASGGSANLPTLSQGQAADLFNVSTRSVGNGRAVLEKGTPELQQAVADGTVSISDAAALADQPAT